MPSKKEIHKTYFCCFRLENSFSVLKQSTKQTADILKHEAPYEAAPFFFNVAGKLCWMLCL